MKYRSLNIWQTMHLVFFCAISFVVAPPASADDEHDVVSRAQQIVRDWNQRDFKAFASDVTQSPDILDEFSPFHWSGPEAVATWNRDYLADASAHAITDTTMEVSAPSSISVSGDRAYAVLPAIARYKQAGRPGTESGILIMSFERVGARWLVSAFAWAKGSS
jgi:hypothetical protein